MAFEKKIIGKIHCPRCNAWAELRIDQKKIDKKWVLVYIVCSICRLNRYSHTTTRKEVILQSRVDRMKEKAASNHTPKRSLISKIELLEKKRDEGSFRDAF